MPSRNAIKQYAAGHYYHLYNRGVEKRRIFMDDRDYRVFLSYFKVALSPELEEETKFEALSQIEEARLRRLKLDKDLELLAYCLMPNHFHLLVYQHTQYAIRDLMRSAMSGYVRYFNKRYDRVGGLFQGRYKASLIDNEAYLWHISRYIHLNSIDTGQKVDTYPYSTYDYYIKKRKAAWLNPNRILQLHADKNDDYQTFVHDYKSNKQTFNEIKSQLAV